MHLYIAIMITSIASANTFMVSHNDHFFCVVKTIIL